MKFPNPEMDKFQYICENLDNLATEQAKGQSSNSENILKDVVEAVVKVKKQVMESSLSQLDKDNFISKLNEIAKKTPLGEKVSALEERIKMVGQRSKIPQDNLVQKTIEEAGQRTKITPDNLKKRTWQINSNKESK